MKSNRVQRICEGCGQSFEANPYRVNHGGARWCSRACRYPSAERIECVCEYCGVTFMRWGSHLKWPGVGRFCSHSCRSKMCVAGEQNGNWKGGRTQSRGRPMVRDAEGTYVPEYRLVMEDMLGRPLRPGEDVHHRDNDVTNSDPDNLQVLSKSEHRRIHVLTQSRLPNGRFG